MQLVFEPARASWEAITRYGEPAMSLPKAAGFKWCSALTRWTSIDPLAALKLRDYADVITQAKLDVDAAAAKLMADVKIQAAAVAVAASRAQDADIIIPIAAGRTFLPYQKAGVAYGLDHKNVLIGDDMGLGKTAQAIGIINADESLKRILVICPASLSRNWVREFGFFGSRPLTIGIATTKAVPDTDIVVCTYDVFSRDTDASKAILAVTWDAMVLDEAHYLKNGDAKRTQVILGANRMQGIRVSKRRIYLTGTPISSRPIHIWPLIHSLAPAEFDNKMFFAKRYCAATQGRFGWDFSGASHLDELQDKLRGLLLVRRLKKDVLAELPAKRRQIIELPADTPELRAVLKLEAATEKRMDGEVAKLQAAVHAASADPEQYKLAVAALRAGQQIAFTEMSRVRHATAVAKAPVVAQHVRDALEADGKIIVFAHHTDVVDHLRTALADLGVVVITGDTPPAKRQGVVDAFQNDAQIRVFIGNIQAAGVGLTLTASSHVIFGELDWVPGNLSQAEDRAHRLGQRNAVLVQHLVLEGSIDARMAATVTAKQAVIDDALDKVEPEADRDARLAAEQTAADAKIADALAKAKALAAAEEAEAIERAARDAKRIADREAQDARRADAIAAVVQLRLAAVADAAAEHIARLRASVAAAAAAMGPVAVPSAEAAVAILACLRVLAELDPDRAAEPNDKGFSATDSSHGHYLSGLSALSGTDAIVGCRMVRRYQRQLDANLVAVALGQPFVVRKVTSAKAAAITEPVEVVLVATDGTPFAAAPPAAAEPAKRRPGRPSLASLGRSPMSQAERNSRYRASHELVAVQIPQAVADKLKAARDGRGTTTEKVLEAALDALREAEIDAELAA